MQSDRQTSTHFDLASCPTHSVHLDGSMMKTSSPGEIASLGHSVSQMPQLMQSEVIISAMSSSWCVCLDGTENAANSGADDNHKLRPVLFAAVRGRPSIWLVEKA